MKSVVIIEGSTVLALVFFYFPANGSTNPDVFRPTTFPRGIIPQNFSSSGLVVSEDIRYKQMNSLTDMLL